MKTIKRLSCVESIKIKIQEKKIIFIHVCDE